MPQGTLFLGADINVEICDTFGREHRHYFGEVPRGRAGSERHEVTLTFMQGRDLRALSTKAAVKLTHQLRHENVVSASIVDLPHISDHDMLDILVVLATPPRMPPKYIPLVKKN